MIYQLKQEQQLAIDIDTAWEFFSSPGNLADITPDHMGFVILGDDPAPMYVGQIIQYTVKPMLNLSFRWVTEITHVRRPHFFVDEQRKGPYKLWHHQHFLIENEDGVLMKDLVTYEPPLGFIGRFANRLFIEKQLKEIFSYRKNYLNELFNDSQR